MKSIIKFILLTLAAVVVSSSLSIIVLADDQVDSDKIYINVGEAKVKKSLIAFPPIHFLGGPSLAPKYKQNGADLYNTILNNIEVSNLFTTIKPDAFLEDTTNLALTSVDFEKWKKIGTDFLLRTGYTINDSKLELEAYLYYVPQGKLVMGKKYLSEVKELRQTAHTFSDDLMKALTGKKGIFRTKFAVASDKGGNSWKEIYVMDWDGRNVVGITNHRSISMSPAWSPTGKTVAYTSYAYHPKIRSRNPDLFTYDIFDGKRYLVSSRRGLNSGSTFTPDGQWIYLTITNGRDPDIFKITLEGDNLTRITNGPRGALNVEPNVSPNGQKVAFSSDRAGNPMIFTMGIDGDNIKRLTFAGKYNSSPSWSPDSKKIAFAGRLQGHFDIFLIDVENPSSIQRLTQATKYNGRPANNEDPSFSPDGRHIVFTSDRTGKQQIYIISVDGTNERRITVDNHNYYKPRWSPYLN